MLPLREYTDTQHAITGSRRRVCTSNTTNNSASTVLLTWNFTMCSSKMRSNIWVNGNSVGEQTKGEDKTRVKYALLMIDLRTAAAIEEIIRGE